VVKPTSFVAGQRGQWRIDAVRAVSGGGLKLAPYLAVTDGSQTPPLSQVSWTLRGTTSSVRYASRLEAEQLSTIQPPLGRNTARLAALIPIRKSEKWWSLAQDERLGIFQDSVHIGIGIEYLPAIARRLYHGRDLGEPFDFLTWFEFSEEASPQFDTLLDRLRGTAEWEYVDREVEVRLRLREPDY
jgi:hypothetical protein